MARLVGIGTRVAVFALLALIGFSGLSYLRVWGPRVVSSAILESVFFAALIGLLILATHIFRAAGKREPDQ